MRLLLHQLRAEQKLFWRSRELAFFTFLLPILFFLLLGSAYGDEEISGVDGYQYLLAGMIGYGAASTTFAGLALLLVIRRESGVLKRLRATPLPPATYVGAVLASIILIFLVEAAILIALGRFGFDVPLADSMVSLVVVLLLGAASFAALGIGLTALIKSAEGSSAVVNALYLPLSFISGAFFSEDAFPQVLQTLAAILPLSHLIELTREVMVFDEEVWDNLGNVAVILAWGVVGLVVSLRGFRWEPRER
ncbi:MAG: ABC transporter permease [Gaiellaceae bacterium]|jgi:ABC-2 type transport system permease protein